MDMEEEPSLFAKELDIAESKEPTVTVTWKSLYTFMNREHIPYLGIATISSIIAGFLKPALASFLGGMFDAFSDFGAGKIGADGLKSDVSRLTSSIMILALLNWFLKTALSMAWTLFGELQAKEARLQLFHSLLEKDLEWYETQSIGIGAQLPRSQTQVVTRIESMASADISHRQIRDLQSATSQPLGHAIEYIVISATALCLAVYTSWRVTLVTLATTPLVAIILFRISARLQPIIATQATEMNISSKLIATILSSIDTVKAFNGQNFEQQKYNLAVSRAAKSYAQQAWIYAVEVGIVRFFSLSMFVQGFWYGSHLTNSGQASAGNVLTCFWACLMSMKAAEDVIPMVIILEKGRAAGAALGAILLKAHEARPDARHVIEKGPRYCEGVIEFQNVSFAYPSRPDNLVLSEVNLLLTAGEIVCIVGKSGSGKSTIGNLLLKFYQPSSGRILIDGQELESLRESWVRENITLIQPQGALFHETIKKNITMGRPGDRRIKQQEIDDCITLTMLHGTIHRMPEGLNTVVGTGGSDLSGGQKQRIAIARARFRDAPVLILDESTSALDYVSRTAIMDNIRKWRTGKTTIIVTHDVSQIRDRDHVYMVEDGLIVSQGYRRDIDLMNQNIHLPPSMQDEGHDNGLVKKNRRYNSKQIVLSATKNGPKSLPSPMKLPLSPLDMHFPRSPRMLVDPLDTPSGNTSLTEFSSNDLTLRPRQGADLGTGLSHARQTLMIVCQNIGPSNRIFLVLGLSFAFLHATCPPTFSWIFSQLLSTFYDIHNTSDKALVWSLAIMGVAIGDATAEFFMHYLLELSGQSWIDELRQKALTRILDQPKEWFEKEENSMSNIMSCLDHNAEEMRNLIGRFAALMLVAFSMASIALIWSFAICWKITVFGICCGPVIYIITKSFQAVSGKWESRTNDASETIGAIFVEALTDIKNVQALTLEPHFRNEFQKAIAMAMKVGRQKAIWTGIFFGGSDSVIFFVTALMFWYGASVASSAAFAVKDIISVFAMLLFSMSNINAIIACIPQINQSLDTATRLLRLSDLPLNASHEYLGSVQISSIGDIRFNAVNFRYPSRPHSLVLKDINMTILEKSCTAIVGQSGSGKSTVTSLLLGLYPAPFSWSRHEPTVTIGGIGIQQLHIPTLRSLIAVVPQKPTIFAASVWANITYGLSLDSPLTSIENVRNAMKAAGIDDFVQGLLNGIETAIGEGGIGISTGQAQRIVIARALCRRPKLLILDEATSALDRDNAEIIRQSILQVMKKRKDLTVLIITHAREMMEIANNVVVLKTGTVVQQGAYEDLSRNNGPLREILTAGGFS